MTTVPQLKCRELVELVTDYLEDRLTPENRRRFDEHLAGCEPCTRYVEQFRTTIRLTGRLREEDLEPQVRDTLLDAFRDWHAR